MNLLLGRDSQHEQIQEERKDGEDVNDIHGVLKENDFLRSSGEPDTEYFRFCSREISESGEPQQIFQSEPGNAGGFYQGQNGILNQVSFQILKH